METWSEDTCVVCRTNDTNYLDDACEECTETWNNWAAATKFAKACLDAGLTVDKIDAYLGGKDGSR